MILTIIRALGRSALRWKWRRKDRRMRAEWAAEPIVASPVTASEILDRLKTTYRDGENPGYYVDAALAREVLTLSAFVFYQPDLYAPPLGMLLGYLGAIHTADGMMRIYRLRPPAPPPRAPDDPPGYISMTRG